MEQDLTRQYYELHAAEYFNATRDVQLTHLWEVITRELPPQALILDLGCGSGRDLRYFSRHGFRVVGLDYSFCLLKLAGGFSHQPVIFGDINRLPFQESTFDAVWAVGSLLHISRNQIAPVLGQIHKTLKPTGQFLASIKKGDGDLIDLMGRRSFLYQPQEWASLLHETRFQISELEEVVERRRIPVGEDRSIPWILSLAQTIDKQQSNTCLETKELSLASSW
jgi:SAM-dependent methyltransferase